MNKVWVVLWALLAVPSLGWATDCSCTKPDGSCSASVSCPAGCYATCGSNCSAGCGSGRLVAQNPYALGTISLEVKGMTAEDLSAVLSKQLGVRVAYTSPEQLNLEVQELGVEDVFNVLSKTGAVAILHSKVADAARIGPGAVLSLRADEVQGSALAEVLSKISGGAISFTPHNAQQPISLDLKGLTAREVVRVLSGLGQARLVNP